MINHHLRILVAGLAPALAGCGSAPAPDLPSTDDDTIVTDGDPSGTDSDPAGTDSVPSGTDSDPSGTDSDPTGADTDATDTDTNDTTSTTPLTLDNVQTVADSHWGVLELSLPYQVATDGILVMSASWYEATLANNPTFNGTDLNLIAHDQTTIGRVRIAQGAMYYLPVTAGQSGDIQITFPAYARRVSMTAVTIAAATSLIGVETTLADVSPSPLELEVDLEVTGPAIVVTLLSSSASIDSIPIGAGHVEDSNPTVPLEEFHDGRAYTGHAVVEPGAHTLGFAQDPDYDPPPSADQIYDAVMVASVFR